MNDKKNSQIGFRVGSLCQGQIVMRVDFRIAHFMVTLCLWVFVLGKIWWETQRIFPLDTNLTKWLSKCEGSFLKGKEKNTIYMVRWWCENLKQYKRSSNKMMIEGERGKQEHERKGKCEIE